MAIVLYMQQALRVLLEELKEDNPNLDLATQTTRDIFAMSTKTLDKLGRTGAYDHVIRRKAAIIDMGLENIKDVAKDLVPELEARKFMPNKRRSSTGDIQYGEKQRRFSDST